MGEFTFPAGERVRRARPASSSPTRSGTPGGIFLFDTGFGSGNPELDESTTRSAPATSLDVLAAAGIDPARDHRHRELPPPPRPLGPERAVPGHPDLRPAGGVGGRPRARLHGPRGHRLRRAPATSTSRATTRSRPGIRIFATPGHSPGHQSLVVDDPGRRRSSSSARRSTATASGRARGRARGLSSTRAGPARVRALGRPPEGAQPEARPVRARPPRLARITPRGPCGVSFAGRARRGTSGALYLQSAPAGLNSPSRSLRSEAAAPGGVEDRVPRSGESRTVSGPEGSSTQRTSSGAAERPDPSCLQWWARVPVGRRGVHGKDLDSRVRARSSIDDVTDQSDVTEPIAPQAHQAIYRRWRAQTFAQVVGQEAVVETLRNAVRTERVAHAILFVGPRGTGKTQPRPDPREGGQLHEPPGRRPVRRLPVVRLDPRRPGDGPGRDRRRVEPRHRRHPRPARADQLRPDRPAPQGLHPRRGPPDHEGRLERAPEVARGAARVRRLHVRLDPPAGVPAGDPVAPPAVRRPAPDDRRDRGQAPADPRRRRPNGLARGRPPHRAARRRRHARRRVDARPAAVVVGRRARRGRVRDLLGLADTETVDGFVDALVANDALAGIRLLDWLEDRGRDLRGFLDQVIEALRAGHRRQPTRRGRGRTDR